MEFQEFPKIGRLSRDVVITEKIDGTNASVYIGVDEDGTPEFLVGSRTRWITPEADNHGFARWAQEHREELLTLGVGHHFGEWWGSGIQRGYGLLKGEKRFSLFNVARWHAVGAEPFVSVSPDPRNPPKSSTDAPLCCGVVPVLYRGPWSSEAVSTQIERLRTFGSVAAPGFLKAEGLVLFHTANGALFKKTLEKDDEPKGVQR
jgi:hypothetical protein